VLGISGGDPSFRDDDGAPDPDVSAALESFAACQGSEHEAMTALATSRLLIPIVALRADPGRTDGMSADGMSADRVSADPGRVAAVPNDVGRPPQGAMPVVGGGEEASDMALPTLIGMDGRRAVPAFTCLDSMHRWQPGARPVPVAARQVWRAATEGSSAVVIDVAGPVPFAVEGARLAALARGDAAPLPWTDPDVREIVAAVLTTHLDVSTFELGPAAERDLAIALTLADSGAGCDAGELAESVGAEVMARLGGRLRRGVEIWLG